MPSPSQYAKHFFVQESNNNSWSNMYAYVPEGARVLDVGCSTGNFGEALKDLKGCTVVGVDISEADVEVAKTKLSEAYVLDISVPGAEKTLGRFDVVVFADVLEHLTDPRGTLAAVHALLNPGGSVVYSIPHMGHESVRFDLLEGRFPYTELGLLDRTHLHFYDRFEVNDIFAAGGFTIIDESPTLSSYPDRWVADRLSTIGLTPNDVFFATLRKTDASIYQFVGRAVPRQEAPALPAQQREEVSPPDQLLNHANGVIAINDALRAENDALKGRVAELSKRTPTRILSALRRAIRR
jgi:SAM-dependent methyltransferase